MTPILLNAGPSPFGWHRYQSHMMCPQKYAFEYLDPNRKRTTSTPLAFGSLAHMGLAHHYARLRAIQQGRDPEAYYPPLRAMELLCEQEGHEAYYDSLPKAKRILEAYMLHYPEEEKKVSIVNVEEFYELQIENAPLTLRADLVIESQGKIYVVDHKTTSRYTRQHEKFYSISGQFIAYSWAGTVLYGEKFGGLLLNILQHGGKKENFKFVRMMLPPAPQHFKKFPSTIVHQYKKMQENMSNTNLADWPSSPTEFTCWHRYGACEFYERCKFGS